MTASVASIAALTSLFNAAPAPALAADDIAITAKLKAAPDAFMLDEATLTSAQQTFEGALEIASAGGRPIVSGTLAADGAAVEPLHRAPGLAVRSGRRMERAAVRARASAGFRR